MSYLEEVLPEFRKGAKIRCKYWKPGDYYKLKNGQIINQNKEKVYYNFFSEAVLTDQWELYQEPIDWQYIIDHKCPCWFWDNKGDEKQIGYLAGIKDNRFYLEAPEDCFNSYSYCRPVRRDEIIFYEGRKHAKKKS